MVFSDWEAVRSIYVQGIATGDATFETQPPSWQSWDGGHLPFARLVAVSDEGIAEGWAALSPVSLRLAYQGVAEVSVYVAQKSQHLGVGRLLLETLILESEVNGIWTLQSSTFPENLPSLALHKACGFREVGIRERIGKLQGLWRNTVLMERRSERVGSD